MKSETTEPQKLGGERNRPFRTMPVSASTREAALPNQPNELRTSGAVEATAARVAAFPRRSALSLVISGMLGAGAAHAQTGASPGDTAAAPTLAPIIVDFRGERMDSPRFTRELLDTPRIITVLPQDLLEEQNVTSMRDMMRNIPGISLQAGEGNPPGGDQLKIRGFNARDDINVNGVRDLGNYFRDPFYVEQVEVVKGPNSAFSGRGSAGGTVNFVTKKPQPTAFNRIETSLGTDDHVRATADLNQPLDSNSALRVNLMTHSADIPGRDVVDERRHGVYAAYTWGFQRDTMVTLDYLHTRQSNRPDQGIPFDREGFTGDPGELNEQGRKGSQRAGDGFYTGRLPPGIDFSNFYGHVDDYQKIDVDIVGVALEHALSDTTFLRNNFRFSQVKNDSIVSSPRIKIPAEFWGSGDFSVAQVQGDLKPRDQKDEAWFNQTDVSFSFDTGNISHDLVAGVEFGRATYENKRRPDVNGPRTSLLDPERRTRPAAPYDGTVHRFEVDEFAVFLLDTVQFNPQWELNAGVRWDRVKAEASDRGWDALGEDPISLSRTDEEWSYSLGLVYKPVPNASIYAAYGTAFEISGTYDRNQVQLAGGGGSRVANPNTFNVDPEQTRAYEIGTKWRVMDGLDINAALFRTDKTQARVPGRGADDPSVLDTRQRVQGVELLVAGRVTPEWRLFGGYTYLDSEVLRSRAWPDLEGQRLGGTPRHSFNVFTTYDLTPRFTLGGGLQHVGSQISSPQEQLDPNPRRRNVSISSYTVADVYTTYRFSPNTQLRVNAFNIFDEDYISQMAEGGAQGIPGKGRHVIATLRYDF